MTKEDMELYSCPLSLYKDIKGKNMNDKTFQIRKLSYLFVIDYPSPPYTELLDKTDARPFNCLIIPNSDMYLCIPFRSNMRHNQNGFYFHSKRSQHGDAPSGLDYQKIVIIKDKKYLGELARIDRDELAQVRHNVKKIHIEAMDYINKYKDYILGKHSLTPESFRRSYRFSTLPYFHRELDLPRNELQIPDYYGWNFRDSSTPLQIRFNTVTKEIFYQFNPSEKINVVKTIRLFKQNWLDYFQNKKGAEKEKEILEVLTHKIEALQLGENSSLNDFITKVEKHGPRYVDEIEYKSLYQELRRQYIILKDQYNNLEKENTYLRENSSQGKNEKSK